MQPLQNAWSHEHTEFQQGLVARASFERGSSCYYILCDENSESVKNENGKEKNQLKLYLKNTCINFAFVMLLNEIERANQFLCLI